MAEHSYHRMPLGYGPSPGPRQNVSTGERHAAWDEVRTQTASIVFHAPKAFLSSFLPHECFSIDSQLPDDQACASLSFTKLENLPWLAGRGYNHFGLYIHDVVCQGRDLTRRGKFLSVLFEDKADPIMSGREELGYPKVFSELLDAYDGTNFKLDLEWEGANFGQLVLSDLHESSEKVSANPASPPPGLLLFKSIPATGSPGKYDVQYPTFSPPPAPGTSITKSTFVPRSSSFSFKDLGFEKLPTLHHIAARLAELEDNLTRIVDMRFTIGQGARDLHDMQAIRI